jgi:hypothetical protein
MKKIFSFFVLMAIFIQLFGDQPLTVAERSNFQQTSSYQDVMDFIFELQKKSDKIVVTQLTSSFENRMIPLVIVSLEGIRNSLERSIHHKPVVLINANIHAGEVEGKEATLMLLRDVAFNRLDNFLKNQIILILPIFNPDGNEKMGLNRRDNGPEQAGVRYNGQYLDLNRDFLKLESPEVKALVKLFNQWDPVLFIDLHTTNGSYHREPVTYTTQINPNIDNSLSDYMWNELFPEVSRTLKVKYGYDSVPYGNFVDRFHPEKGWRNWALDARFSFNYFGLRNRFSILNENYSHADFKTRVMSCYCFLKAILEYSNTHIQNMQQKVLQSDLNTKSSYWNNSFVSESKTEKLFNIKLKSYRFEKEKIKPEDKKKYPPWIGDYRVKKTDEPVDYDLPYFIRPAAIKSAPLPEAYILLPHHPHIVEKIKSHGIIIEKIRSDFQTTIEEIVIDKIKPSSQIYQGHIRLECQVHYQKQTRSIPAQSYFISMKQPLARLIPILLEPESQDSLVSWGFFNREIVSQWFNQPRPYPVYRLPRVLPGIERYQD